MVVGAIALVLALAGSSVAAPVRALVTGKQIRNGSVTGADVRNRSLTARDFKTASLPAGPTGPAGAPGAPGAPGEDGAAGKDGAPGLVRAYAVINGTDLEFRNGSRHPGITGVRGLGDGAFCLALAPGIDAATAVPAVTVDTPGTPSLGGDADVPHAMVDRQIDCDADEIGVRTRLMFFNGGALEGDGDFDVDFSILVP